MAIPQNHGGGSAVSGHSPRDLPVRSVATVAGFIGEELEQETTFTMHWLEGADHGFRVQKRSGRRDDEVLAEAADVVSRWVRWVVDADDTGDGRREGDGPSPW